VRSGRRPAGKARRLRRPRKAGPVARYGAPAGFLLAATVAILLIHSALGGKTVPLPAPTQAPPPVTRTAVAAKPNPKPRPKPAARYHVVQSGEGFAAIAAAEHTSVSQIEALNPGISSNALHVGQKIRVG
jgi:LysM repeat protein